MRTEVVVEPMRPFQTGQLAGETEFVELAATWSRTEMGYFKTSSCFGHEKNANIFTKSSEFLNWSLTPHKDLFLSYYSLWFAST